MDFNMKRKKKILIPQFSKLQLYDTKFRRLSDDNKTYKVHLNHYSSIVLRHIFRGRFYIVPELCN